MINYRARVVGISKTLITGHILTRASDLCETTQNIYYFNVRNDENATFYHIFMGFDGATALCIVLYLTGQLDICSAANVRFGQFVGLTRRNFEFLSRM